MESINTQILDDFQDYDEVRREQEAEDRRQSRLLDDLAFVFLNACGWDRNDAHKLFEQSLNLLLEGNSLCMWRYRYVLSVIGGKEADPAEPWVEFYRLANGNVDRHGRF